MKLINSDLWDFIREDKLGGKIDQFAGEYDSNYEGPLDGVEDDAEWNREIKELEELQSRIRKGPRVDLYKSQTSKVMEMSQSVSEVDAEAKDLKGYDSDINLNIKTFDLSKIQDGKQKPLGIKREDLGRIHDLSSNLPSSVEDLEVSKINIANRRKASRDKGMIHTKLGSRLPGGLDGKDSDYEGVMQTKLKLGEINSDVSMSSSVQSKALKMVDSDVSVNFKRKK